MPTVRRIFLLLLFLVPFIPVGAAAAIREEVIDVPVSVKNIRGEVVNHSIKVTVFRDDAVAKSPYLILNHGRSTTKEGRANLKRARYSQNSRYFVSLGFVVFVPTRIGYGETGGVDVEDSGPCNNRQFEPAYAAAAEQTVAVLKAAEKLPYVDLSRGIVAGQSFGGLTALKLSTMPLPGLRAAVNFAGGGGGNPVKRTGNPCSPDRLMALYEGYGTNCKVPTLWIYSENDRYWGPDLPKQWHATFTGAGGRADFVKLPPHGGYGHGIFTGDPDAWKPAFAKFIRELGF